MSEILGEEEAADVRLAASELVTNAMWHGRLSEEDEISLSATLDEGC